MNDRGRVVVRLAASEDTDSVVTGVGRVLLATLEEEARRQGLRELSVESTVSARGFYFRHGYRPRGNGAPDSSLLCKMLVG
jgi:histone acetyltransferase (RNA polymerase elongator complex component)